MCALGILPLLFHSIDSQRVTRANICENALTLARVWKSNVHTHIYIYSVILPDFDMHKVY